MEGRSWPKAILAQDRFSSSRFTDPFGHVSQRQRDCIWDRKSASDLDDVSDLCVLGSASATPQFLVWGDSHADSLLPVFDELAEQNGLEGVHAALSACPPVLGARITAQSKCDTFNTAIVDLVIDSGITDVLLVGFWNVYRKPELALESTDGSNRNLSPDESLEFHLTNAVNTLNDAGVQVWLFKDVPVFDFDPPRRLSVATRFGQGVSSIGMSISEYEEQAEKSDGLFEELKSMGVLVIDPTPELCSGDFCSAFNNDTVFYRDRGHLSIEGALEIAPVFDEFVQAMSR